MVVYRIGQIMMLEAVLLILPLLVSLLYGETKCLLSFCAAIGTALLLGVIPMIFMKPRDNVMFAREGFTIVSFAWILLSLVGAFISLDVDLEVVTNCRRQNFHVLRVPGMDDVRCHRLLIENRRQLALQRRFQHICVVQRLNQMTEQHGFFVREEDLLRVLCLTGLITIKPVYIPGVEFHVVPVLPECCKVSEHRALGKIQSLHHFIKRDAVVTCQ